MLKTVASPRFRRLTFFVVPPLSVARVQQYWKALDEEVTALAKRVGATAVSDTLQVLFYCYRTTFADINAVFPRVTSDARVSLRVENCPTPGAQSIDFPEFVPPQPAAIVE